MTITINGSGSITGLSAGGLPDATITQADLASGVAGNGPAFSARSASETTVATQTLTKLNTATETFDTNSCFDPSTGRFTPNVAGYYQINWAVQFVTNTPTAVWFNARLFRNGSQLIEGSLAYAFLYAVNYSSVIVYANGTTDYFEIYGFHTNSSSSLMNLSHFSASLVRAA